MQYEITRDDIPDNIDWLYDIVGPEKFMKIIDTGGGEVLYIPNRRAIERPARYRSIRKRHAEGCSAKEIALAHGITVRRVMAIIAGEETTHE